MHQKDRYLAVYYFLTYISYLCHSAPLLEPNLFAYDTCLFYLNNNVKELFRTMNGEILEVMIDDNLIWKTRVSGVECRVSGKKNFRVLEFLLKQVAF